MNNSETNLNKDEKLLKVVLNEEIEICSLGITSSLKLDQKTFEMLKNYTTNELNERLHLFENDLLTANDYEIDLSKAECSTAKELYESNGYFIIKPNKDISGLINRQKIIESLFTIDGQIIEICQESEMNKLKQGKQKRSSKSSMKHELLIEIEKVNLKLQNYKIENEYRIKNDIKDLKEICEMRYMNKRKYFENMIDEVKEELSYLRNENKNLVNLLTCFNEAIFKTDFYIDSYNKRNLINEFMKKCSKNLNIKKDELTLKNIDIDKYNLKRDDLTSIIMFGPLNQDKNIPMAREIALSILTTSVNKDSWKRIFQATFDSTPEEMLTEDDTLSV